MPTILMQRLRPLKVQLINTKLSELFGIMGKEYEVMTFPFRVLGTGPIVRLRNLSANASRKPFPQGQEFS